MTAKLFVALYVGLIVGMIVLFIVNFAVAWIFFAFVFVATFGGLMVADRPHLIAAGFLLVSLIVAVLGVYAMQQSTQAGAWPTAEGVISSSRLCTRVTNGQADYSGPCIDYRYVVRGQTFEASSIDTGEFGQFGLWWLITGIPYRYRVNQEIDVHYDPSNPANSRLVPGIPPGNWITTAVGAIMAALSAFTLFWVLRPKREPSTVSVASLKDGQAVHTPRPARTRRRSQPPTVPDIADQLEKLAALHEKGSITDEEYELAKKRLLGPP